MGLQRSPPGDSRVGSPSLAGAWVWRWVRGSNAPLQNLLARNPDAPRRFSSRFLVSEAESVSGHHLPSETARLLAGRRKTMSVVIATLPRACPKAEPPSRNANLKLAKIIDRPGLCAMVRAAGRVPSARRSNMHRSAWIADVHATGPCQPAAARDAGAEKMMIGWHPPETLSEPDRAC